jgi:DNA polymerase III subunit delta'
VSFPDFYGNVDVAGNLAEMMRSERIPQTILLAGPSGVGKATLVRRFAAELLGDKAKIEADDLSSEANLATLAEREKLPSEKRSEDPFHLASHPDFLTFPPDGPLRQISIQQMRLLKERAQFQPLKGRHRIFLIDQLDRANEQAANSLLKILEEPPPYLILLCTAENAYDLLPTIRSRSLIFNLRRLDPADMSDFVQRRGLSHPQRRLALANGCPGAAVALDIESYDKRREAMLKLLETGAGKATFSDWGRYSEAIAMRKTEKLEDQLHVLYDLMEDLLLIQQGRSALRNPDIEGQLRPLAVQVSFEWIRSATRKVDDLVHMLRRNIQKNIALDALALELRQCR